MSADAHRREAGREREARVKHIEHFDPNAERIAPLNTPMKDTGAETMDVVPEYNPTRWNLEEAARHGKHAQAHERAAEQLEKFESIECGKYAAGVRASCPFIGPVRAVESIASGVRLRLAAGAPVAQVAAHMRCHLAFSRSRAFEVSECPLTLRGTTVTIADNGTAIDVTSPEQKTSEELRRRAAALVTPKP